MSAPIPTFRLPPCPLCSSTMSFEYPFWRFAHHTSRVRRKNVYQFTGCAHAVEVGNSSKLRDDPEEWRLVEDAWAEACARMFEAKTAKWPERARANFKRILDDKPRIAGLTELIDFTPEGAQHEPTKEGK